MRSWGITETETWQQHAWGNISTFQEEIKSWTKKREEELKVANSFHSSVLRRKIPLFHSIHFSSQLSIIKEDFCLTHSSYLVRCATVCSCGWKIIQRISSFVSWCWSLTLFFATSTYTELPGWANWNQHSHRVTWECVALSSAYVRTGNVAWVG